MNQGVSIWGVLGIAATQDARAIRRAYAQRLKVASPEDDAQGFQLLRAAYEQAMMLAAHAQAADQSPQSAQVDAISTPGSGEVPPGEPASPVADAEPSAPEDEELRVAAAHFSALELALRGAPPEDLRAEVRLVEALLLSPTMYRLDIHQRAEYALAQLLADRIPRSDHLLETVMKFFAWDRRAHEGTLPDAARQVLARSGDVEFLAALRQRDDKYTRAYERLLSNQPSRWRWLRASLDEEPEELQLLRKLSDGHRNLLAQIPQENLGWWEKFGRRPRISRALLFTGLTFTGLSIVFALIDKMSGSNEISAGLVMAVAGFWLAGTAGAVAFKFFAIDIPAHRIQERWRGSPPPKLALGWLPAGIVLLLAAVAVREVAWAAWAVAGLAAATWLWACHVAGPAERIAMRQSFLEARWVAVCLVNVPLVFWLMTVGEDAVNFSLPTYLAFVFVLLASGIAQRLQSWMYRTLLDWRLRALSAVLASCMVVACIAWVAVDGRDAGAKPWIVAVVVALMLLRRASPFGLFIGHWVLAPIALGMGWLAAANVVEAFDLDPRPTDYAASRAVVTGALVFLAGAMYSLVREIIEALRSRGATPQ